MTKTNVNTTEIKAKELMTKTSGPRAERRQRGEVIVDTLLMVKNNDGIKKTRLEGAIGLAPKQTILEELLENGHITENDGFHITKKGLDFLRMLQEIHQKHAVV